MALQSYVVCACGARVRSKYFQEHVARYCPQKVHQPPPTEREQVQRAVDLAVALRNAR